MNPFVTITRAIDKLGHLRGSRPIDSLLSDLPGSIQARLTRAEWEVVVSTVTARYHAGRAACRGELSDRDSVWIGAGVNRLIPLDAIRAILVYRTELAEFKSVHGIAHPDGEYFDRKGNAVDTDTVVAANGHEYYSRTMTVRTNYKLDYTTEG